MRIAMRQRRRGRLLVEACSLRTSLGRVLGLWGSFGLNPSAGPIAGDEDLIGNAADIGLGNLVHLVEMEEEFAPIAVAGLVLGQVVGQALVVSKSTQQVGTGTGFEHRELFVGYVGGLQLFDLLTDGIADLLWCVSGIGHRIEDKHARVFAAGEGAGALGFSSDLLVADKAAIEAGDAAIGKDVADSVVDRIIGVAIVGGIPPYRWAGWDRG